MGSQGSDGDTAGQDGTGEVWGAPAARDHHGAARSPRGVRGHGGPEGDGREATVAWQSWGQHTGMGRGGDTTCGQLAGTGSGGTPQPGATPRSPPQPGKASLRVQVRVCRALFITRQAGTAQGAGGRRHRGRSCPSCDLGVGTGTVVRTRAEAAGAEAKPAASPAHDLFPASRAQPKQLLPLCNAALAKPLPSPVPVPIPVGNTWHPYLQSKTELTDITNN